MRGLGALPDRLHPFAAAGTRIVHFAAIEKLRPSVNVKLPDVTILTQVRALRDMLADRLLN
jgi:hypothetical protein